MALVCKPQIEVPNIELEIDQENEEGARRIMNTWGLNVPVIQIGEYILNIEQIQGFELQVRINTLPEFSITVDDPDLNIRKQLKADIDKCIIFIGYKTWYLRFEGLIRRTFSEAGSSVILLEGILWNDALYKTAQKCYKEMTLDDIYKEIVNDTKLGLYTTENDYLTASWDFIINPGMRSLEFVKYLTEKYSKNIWCIDPLYYLHIGNIEKLRERAAQEDYDTRTLDNKGDAIDETPIIITSNIYPGESDEEIAEDAKKVHSEFYTIDTNFSDTYEKSFSQYFVNETELPSNNEVGIGTSYKNTFPTNGEIDTFEKHNLPYYREIVNKLIGGTLIKVETKNIIFELSPFDIVNFECFLPHSGNEPIRKDDEHSGAKIVIGYGYKYLQEDAESTMIQTIELI